MWNRKTGIYWRLIRFAGNYCKTVKDHDWAAMKKNGMYVLPGDADSPKDLERDYEYLLAYDAVFMGVSENIALQSRAGHTGSKITASDQEKIRQYDRLLAEDPVNYHYILDPMHIEIF